MDFVQITSPPSPQFGQLVQLFSDVEIQDLKVSLGLKVLYILYLYNLKDSSKLKLLALEEVDSFFTKNAPLENVPKNLDRASPPLIPAMPKKCLKECIFF